MSTSASDDTTPPAKLSRVPTWIPFAAFAGTSIALAIPIAMLARRRTNVLRKALSGSAPPPPRRAVSTSSAAAAPLRQPRIIPPSTPVAAASESASKPEFTMPSTGELFSAVSKSDLGNAMFAGKALAIATGIVTIGAAATVVGVKAIMGVNNTKEFAERVQIMMWRAFPGLTSTIHRPSATDEAQGDQSFKGHFIESWTWPEAEKRLELAWEQGGFGSWAKVAAHELEAELQVERAKRLREHEEAQARNTS